MTLFRRRALDFVFFVGSAFGLALIALSADCCDGGASAVWSMELIWMVADFHDLCPRTK